MFNIARVRVVDCAVAHAKGTLTAFMEKCFVELRCDAHLLEIWRRLFPCQGDPYVSDFTVPNGDGGERVVCGFSCKEFRHLDEAHAVYTIAKRVFSEMKGWVIAEHGSIGDGPASHIGAVYILAESGEYQNTQTIEGSAHINITIFGSGRITAYDLDGNEIEAKREPPQPTLGQNALSSADDDLKAALRYISGSNGEDWNQLYRAFDAVGKVNGLQRAGVPRQNAVLLAQTFSVHRKHHTLPLNAPPMSFHEARSLILQTVKKRAGVC